MIVGALLLQASSEDRQSRLEEVGDRFAGTVTCANYDPKTPDRLCVEFSDDGGAKEVQVSGDGFEVGDEVVVLVDPDDPAIVGIDGGERLSGLRHGAALALLVTGLFVLTPLAIWLLASPYWRSRRSRAHRSAEQGT